MGDSVKLTGADAKAAYAICMEECGAPEMDEGQMVHSFIPYLTDTDQGEWRFMGRLGFGGKLYFNPWDGLRVGCYPEHETRERVHMIAAANKRLAALTKDHPDAR